MNQSIKLIVGLKNPGDRYEKTRHNAGAWFCEEFAQSQALFFSTQKSCFSDVSQWNCGQSVCRIALPLGYMNESGRAVQALMQFYKIKPEEVLVVHDELDLPCGQIKLKRSGGHGGHNGLRDIIQKVGRDFWRLRIGIGHPGHKDQVVGYVLSKPSHEQKQLIDESIAKAIQHVDLAVAGEFEKAMNALHSR